MGQELRVGRELLANAFQFVDGHGLTPCFTQRRMWRMAMYLMHDVPQNEPSYAAYLHWSSIL